MRVGPTPPLLLFIGVVAVAAHCEAARPEIGIVQACRDLFRVVYAEPARLGPVEITVETEPFELDTLPMRASVIVPKRRESQETTPEILRVRVTFTNDRLSAFSADGPFLREPAAISEATLNERIARAVQGIIKLTQ